MHLDISKERNCLMEEMIECRMGNVTTERKQYAKKKQKNRYSNAYENKKKQKRKSIRLKASRIIPCKIDEVRMTVIS